MSTDTLYWEQCKAVRQDINLMQTINHPVQPGHKIQMMMGYVRQDYYTDAKPQQHTVVVVRPTPQTIGVFSTIEEAKQVLETLVRLSL
jgi:hypothetical protein